MSAPRLASDGAERHPRAACAVLAPLADLFGQSRPGVRCVSVGALQPELEPGGRIGAIAAGYLGPKARPVRAVIFDKFDGANWALGWHQDRTICVAERFETTGFERWSVKQGLVHVAPPFALLERMITLRVHVDPVDEENAPLRVALGSHLLGSIAEPRISAIAAQCRHWSCLAASGDVWAYSTPILHASDRAAKPRQRRVLQIDYSADTLPAPLRWRGIN